MESGRGAVVAYADWPECQRAPNLIPRGRIQCRQPPSDARSAFTEQI